MSNLSEYQLKVRNREFRESIRDLLREPEILEEDEDILMEIMDNTYFRIYTSEDYQSFLRIKEKRNQRG